MTTTIEGLTGLRGDYLADWDEFVGQDSAKRMLKIACRSAQLRNDRLEHLFFAGQGGLGKTTLAILCALEMGKKPRVVSGSIDVKQFRILLSDMNDGDVLVWDEVHLAVVGGKSKAEFLLNFLQDGVVAGPMGPEEAPNITVIAATTDSGRLPETILSRFRRVELTDYDDDEAVMIAEGWIWRLLDPHGLPYPSVDNLMGIARAASNNPRAMRQIVVMTRDIALATDRANWDSHANTYDLGMALEMLGLTADGLTPTAQRYLIALVKDFAGGAGERALADRLNEPGGLRHVERLLADKGLIVKTQAGRVLTKAGIGRAKELTS